MRRQQLDPDKVADLRAILAEFDSERDRWFPAEHVEAGVGASHERTSSGFGRFDPFD